jgi:hypothetical protein
MSHGTQELAQFADVQLTVMVPVGLCELGFEEAQQLHLRDLAMIVVPDLWGFLQHRWIPLRLRHSL